MQQSKIFLSFILVLLTHQASASVAAAIIASCAPQPKNEFGHVAADPNREDRTAPVVETNVNPYENDSEYFSVSKDLKTGTIHDCEHNGNILLPIDIVIPREHFWDTSITKENVRVYVGDLDTTNQVWLTGLGAMELNLVDQSAIIIDSGITALEVKGHVSEIEGGMRFLWTYDPAKDDLEDDRWWSFPFYVVVTDMAGNQTVAEPVYFENIRDCY